MKHFSLEIFEHLNILYYFKCPNSNSYDLIQRPYDGLGKCAPLLAEVLNQGKNDGHFRRAFQVH